MTRYLHVRAPLLASVAGLAIAGGCSIDIVDTLVGNTGQAADGDTGLTLGDGGNVGDWGEGGDDLGDDLGEDGPASPLFDVGEGESSISCEFAAQFPSHIGCEFYGVDLDGPGLFDQDPFGFVVINPLSDPVEVTLERHGERGWTVVESRMVEGSDEAVLLPANSEVHGTGLHDHATLRMTATAPVIVIQASPAKGQAYSASATVLQPTAAWSTHNPVAGWRTHLGVGEPSFLAVVAQSSGTSVAVTPMFGIANIPPSWEPWIEIIDPDAEPVSIVVTLPVEPGQLLRLDATAIDAAEVDHGTSGTTVESGQEHLISVFSAHTCAAIPDYEGSCGHMQEQLSPRLVGTQFVGPRLVAGDTGLGPDAELGHERTMIQVAATEPNTHVVFSYLDAQDSVVEVDSVIMDPDEPFAIYEYDHELSVSADRPIVAAAYMTNAELTGLGSASMVQLAPVDQWTGSHWVWVPEGFETHLLVSAGTGAAVEVEWLTGLDGDDTPQPAAVLLEANHTAADGAGPWLVRRYAVEPGIYRVESSRRASVVVSGWAPGDGFAYLAGWGPSLADLGPAG
ncbi:IgGFc-binding protein [Enhygromyxa salina]|uniref:IgGFc-binding protein N-terminal domain-containing protein n=1 Tax=Enhygromyxa salina TaxID=215803 RepID=A0A2S9YH42_9BACT|nr:IgGFc-binding protein [Enhygromyxa salina]PRQ04435.1 hypothetical protein ENSA7_50960 [Enhygromyxa salina]